MSQTTLTRAIKRRVAGTSRLAGFSTNDWVDYLLSRLTVEGVLLKEKEVSLGTDQFIHEVQSRAFVITKRYLSLKRSNTVCARVLSAYERLNAGGYNV